MGDVPGWRRPERANEAADRAYWMQQACYGARVDVKSTVDFLSHACTHLTKARERQSTERLETYIHSKSGWRIRSAARFYCDFLQI